MTHGESHAEPGDLVVDEHRDLRQRKTCSSAWTSSRVVSIPTETRMNPFMHSSSAARADA